MADVRIVSRWEDCVVSEASLGKRIAPWAERLIDGEKVLL